MKTRKALTSNILGTIAIALSLTAMSASAGPQADVVMRMQRFDQLDFDAGRAVSGVRLITC
jgi:hypothetical protein